MKKTRSKKKIIISVLCVLLALAVLTPCVINAVVMLSASKYIISADEAAGRGADCVLVLGAKVNSNGTLSHMLEDRMSTGVDLYQSGAGKKILASGDHGRDSYDEVNHMKQYAVGRGVDPDDVFLDHAGNAFVSAYRTYANEEHTEVDIHVEYMATPCLDGKTLIIADPMLATGGSMELGYRALLTKGTPRQIHVACVIATPEGIEHIKRTMPDDRTTIWCAVIDPGMNENKYIVPGFGDAGDLCYGEKL